MSIASVRDRLRTILIGEMTRPVPRDVIVLALDGVCRREAMALGASVLVPLRSTFPTTSSTAWITSLTGADVASHGVPGVMFRVPGEGLVDVYRHRGPLGRPALRTAFHDAAELGYDATVVLADLLPFPSTWRDRIVAGARQIEGEPFYARGGTPDPDALVAGLRQAISASGRPQLTWICVDIDQYVHRNGYDGYFNSVLRALGRLACLWDAEGKITVMYSDHGLVPTHHEPEIASWLQELGHEFGCPQGGAGRTRWLYCGQSRVAWTMSWLRERLDDSVRIAHAQEMFAPAVLPWVGELVLIAQDEGFLAAPEIRFEHGSMLPDELDVFFAVWS